jgi:hypothetical protein
MFLKMAKLPLLLPPSARFIRPVIYEDANTTRTLCREARRPSNVFDFLTPTIRIFCFLDISTRCFLEAVLFDLENKTPFMRFQNQHALLVEKHGVRPFFSIF